MQKPQVGAVAQEIDWLTPTPRGTSVELPWPEATGPFLLICHMAQVDGRTQLVGLDVRSFRDQGEETPEPGPRGLSEINYQLVRSLNISEIAEAARARLATELGVEARSRIGTAAARKEAGRRHDLLTSPSGPRPTGRRPASEQLQKVADFYREALALGGETASKPAIYVHFKLAESGSNITLNAVRGQIFRAQQKGLIPKLRS